MIDRRSGLFLRPRAWAFWAYLVAFVVGALLWPAVFTGGVAARFWAAAIAWVAVLGALLASLIRRLDLFRGNQVPLLVAAFLWGAVPASAFALRINSVLLAEFDRYLVGYQAWDAAAVAPVVEESIKAVGIVVVVLIGRRYVVRATQGAVIGAVCGLGFQLVEDINYVLNAAAGRLDSAVGAGWLSSDAGVAMTVVMRTVTAADSHWLFSGLVGLGIGYALVLRERQAASRVVAVAALFAAAVGTHFVADSPEPANAFAFPLTVGKVVVTVVLGYVIYAFAMRAEWRRLGAVASTELADVITTVDVDALRSHRKRRGARKRVRVESGSKAARLVPPLQRGQLRLVNEIMREGDAPQRRAEVQRLRARVYPTAPAAAGYP